MKLLSQTVSVMVALAATACFESVTLQVEAATAACPPGEIVQKKHIHHLTLTDLYETGLDLVRIRQQAINMYVEATRLPVHDDKVLQIADPDVIPVAGAPTDFSVYLDPRRTWLVFYLGTMEPIIEMLDGDVKDVQNGTSKVNVPHALKGKWKPLWTDWSTGVHQMNAHLSTLLPLIDDAPANNKQIAELAVDIFEDTNKLEQLRKEVAKVVLDLEKPTTPSPQGR